MAISKERKEEVFAQYGEWMKHSQAMIVTQYTGLSMKSMDELRRKVREAGGEFHIVKNTIAELAFKEAGIPLPKGIFEGSSAVGFAFQDPPALAKVFVDFGRTAEVVKIKGGFLGASPMTAEQVKSLADLPPLPVMRAQLLGVILAPASQLARTLAEPARSLAAVFKAFADRDAAAEAA